MTIYYGKQQRGSRIGDGNNSSAPNTLKIGEVATLAPGSKATADITGEAPNQTVNFGIPVGNNGTTPKITMGTTSTLKAGSKATADLVATSDGYQLNIAIPAGIDGVSPAAPTMSAGTVSTLSAGSKSTAEIVASGGNYQINLGIPKGDPGTNATPVQMETVISAVVTAGQKVAITFTKKYSVPPIVIPNAIWVGSQMVIGQASEITTTGCNVTVMQSVGTLLLNGSPFTSAPAKTQFSVFVTGS